MRRLLTIVLSLSVLVVLSVGEATSQDGSPTASSAKAKRPRGSLVEDRAAKKLVEAGDSRVEAGELKKAVEVWQSVIERYPRSRLRYQAHMRLGNFFLERDRAYDRARAHFEAIASEENRDEEQRAESTLKIGVCFYQARNFGKCFSVMRDVIEHFPVSAQVNQAYYYIGLGHFQLGHYSRAIAALEKVGTNMSAEDDQVAKVEAGKRFFVRIDDADLAALEPGKPVRVTVSVTSGDSETVNCFTVGRNVRIALGSIPTRLGRPKKENGRLEVKGDDTVTVTYTDSHTADKKIDQPVLNTVTVVGDGVAAITDGAFQETLQGAVLGKAINLQVSDPDRDLTDGSDRIVAVIEVYRKKTDEEIETELLERATESDSDPKPAAGNATNRNAADVGESDERDEDEIERFKKIDEVKVTLAEVRIEPKVTGLDGALPDVKRAGEDPVAEPAKQPAKHPAGKPAAKTAAKTAGKPAAKTDTQDDKSPSVPKSASEPASEPVVDNSIHTGVFRTTVTLAKAETIIAGDSILQALPGDKVRLVYLDERNSSDGVYQVQSEARCIEGNLGGVRVTRAVISDLELRLQTELKTAGALTNIASRYKEFGLKSNANDKYKQALAVCERVARSASKLGGRILEETYVQLWQIYFEMDRLELAAAMAQRLQRDFPNSGFVDDALLQLADVARKRGNLRRAIGIYNRLASMKTSQLRGEAQFGIAQCYEQMATDSSGTAAAQLTDRAFQEYKKVFDQHPDSGRVGEAVSRMANYYYQQRDFARAIDTFETVLSDYPDAKFLDVILFNYGRCLYRMNRRPEASRKFDQLIQEFPESPLASDAKKISDALSRPKPTPTPDASGSSGADEGAGR
jgi:TolA-binding protein